MSAIIVAIFFGCGYEDPKHVVIKGEYRTVETHLAGVLKQGKDGVQEYPMNNKEL